MLLKEVVILSYPVTWLGILHSWSLGKSHPVHYPREEWNTTTVHYKFFIFVKVTLTSTFVRHQTCWDALKRTPCLLVVVSPPRFTIKPPAKVVAWVGETLILNCSATGDPQPVISWKKQGGQLPVGRSQQINGSLVIRSLTLNDKGNYICVAPYAGVFKAETITYTEVHKGRFHP